MGSVDRGGTFHPGTLRPHGPECGTRVGASDNVVWCLACEYAWTYNAAHDRTVGESNGARGAIAFSDPTGSIVAGPIPEEDAWSPEVESMMRRPNPKAAARERCIKAFSDLRRVINSVDSIDALLRSAMRNVDPPHAARAKDPSDTEDNRKRLMSEADQRAYVAAAARRRGRGEGFGEG